MAVRPTITQPALAPRIATALATALAPAFAPLEHPIWCFAIAAGIGTFSLTLLSSANLSSALLAAGCGFTVTMLGLRLGFVLAFGVACIPAIVNGRLAATAFSIPWNAALALLLIANIRAVLLSSGPALRSGAILSPRPWRRASTQPEPVTESRPELGAESPLQRGGAVLGSIESWSQWLAELAALTFVLTLAGALFEAAAWVLGSVLSPQQGVRTLAIGALAALALCAALVSLISLLRAYRRNGPAEARMILTQSLYRELRSELIDLTRRRARKRH